MRTIAIVNEKGGTGKTTTAVSLAAGLGQLRYRILLVDLDGQAASSRWLGVQNDTSFADALYCGQGLQPIPDVAEGVSLAPGSEKLDSVAHDLRPTQGGQLRKLLGQVSGFDYCIVDCPPSLGNRLIGNALLAATHAIVPVETSILALDGLKILLTTLEDVRDGFGHEIELSGVLACRYDARTRLSRFVLEELRRALPGKVFQTVIRENVRVRECPASGQSIFAYAPASRAAEDYMALAHEVAGMYRSQQSDETVAPPMSLEELPADDRSAISDMRRQVDAMVRELGAGMATLGPRERPAGANSTADQAPPVDAEPAQADEPSPAGAGEVMPLSAEPANEEQAIAQTPPAECREDYPALRAMLQSLTTEQPSQAGDSGADGPGRGSGERPGWRRILGKRAQAQ